MRRPPIPSCAGAPAQAGGSAFAGPARRARAQAGNLRFTLLALSIVVTAVVVTIVMFQTLAMLVG